MEIFTMALANRRLIQVVPQLKPARCGVSDHAIALASELGTGFGIDSAFVVLNSDEPSGVPYPVVHCSPDQLLNACISFSTNESTAILVHVSGYGYSEDGAPALLAEALRDVKASSRFRIAVFFHELYACGMPWTSAFWNARRQKRVLRRIVEVCDLPITNIRVFADWLDRETFRQSASRVQYLPVFSLVGEAQEPVPQAYRDPVMAVFGLGETRQRAYTELSTLGNTMHQLGVEEILDIGSACEVPRELSVIPVRRLGVLAAADIDRQFMRTAFGYLAYPPNCLAKSGVFAGYSAHGVIPVIAQHFRGEFDGLQDGVHLLSPRTAKSIEPAGLEQCSIAAWRWYAGHRLHDHAALYARWMDSSTDEMESAPQSADRKK
jgi:hypothetical protein